MHQLSLYGQISQSRHTQLLQILAGVAAMPPQAVTERHLIFKPVRQPVRRAVQVGASQGIIQEPAKLARQAQASGDLYLLRLVQHLSPEAEDEAERGDEQEVDVEMTVDGEEDPGAERPRAKSPWELRFYDLPEAGKRANTAQLTSTTELEEGDPVGFMAGIGYECTHQYLLSGHRLIHNNIILLLHRLFPLPSPTSVPDLTAFTPSSVRELAPLDESGAYAIHAFVRVLDGSRPESMARASAELAQFKELMKGVVDMRPAERLALDTRVK